MIDPDVQNAAKTGEPERYLAALLASESVRDDLLALAAFSAEMRRIPALIGEAMIGEIRLQWWRDAIGGFADGQTTTGHPIADALGAAVRRHRLPAPVLAAMTEARAFDLYDDPMADEAAFRAYLGKTEGQLFALAFRVVAGRDAPLELIEAAAASYGLARLLGDLPHWLARGRCPIPAASLAGVPMEELLAGDRNPAVRVFMQQQCDAIAAAYGTVRHMARNLTRTERVAWLAVACTPTYLKQLRRASRDPLRAPVVIDPARRALRIASAYALGL